MRHQRCYTCFKLSKLILHALYVCACVLLQLGPLSGITSLQQLDVSCNRVSSLSALAGLSGLTQPCCEDNAIASLAGVGGLSSLVELYAAHNSLANIKVRTVQVAGQRQATKQRCWVTQGCWNLYRRWLVVGSNAWPGVIFAGARVGTVGHQSSTNVLEHLIVLAAAGG